jgi:tRNA (mo5U34)-methyltransferase
MNVTTQAQPLTSEQIKAMVAAVPRWFHSIDLGHGIVTPGHKPVSLLNSELRRFQLPDLSGKSVLDIGAWDGFFSFACERLGARTVTALDQYVWSLDVRKTREATQKNAADSDWLTNRVFDLEHLPGKAGFDLARRVLNSQVKEQVVDFMEADPVEIGVHDVVLFLGVLYHMQDPFDALRRVAAMTGEVAIIETLAVAIDGYEDRSLCEFFEGDEMNNDPTNWWAPNAKALAGMCRAAGFKRVELLSDAPVPEVGQVRHYRAILHAYKT